MRYRGSEAVDLDMQESTDPGYGYVTYGGPLVSGRDASVTNRRSGRSLVVVEGGHLDADAREGVSPEFLRRARLVVMVVVAFCALGALRVALTAGTVSLMSGNMKLSTHIEEAAALNDELHAERSLLSSSHRITAIATQNYGMVYAPSGVTAGSASGGASAADASTSTSDSDGGGSGNGAVSATMGVCDGSGGTSADTAQDAG